MLILSDDGLWFYGDHKYCDGVILQVSILYRSFCQTNFKQIPLDINEAQDIPLSQSTQESYHS